MRSVHPGGGFFGLLCKNNRFRRTSVVFLGMVVHFIAFYLIFLNIPNDAPVVFETTTQRNPYLTPRWITERKEEWNLRKPSHDSVCVLSLSLSVSIALLCSFLLGLGDSCFNTQLYSILGRVYAEQSTPAFAIFKFIQVIPTCRFSGAVSTREQSRAGSGDVVPPSVK